MLRGRYYSFICLLFLDCIRGTTSETADFVPTLSLIIMERMVKTFSPVCDFDQPAHDFSLPGVDGKTHTLADCRGENGTLVMFICNHCPFVQAILPKLTRDASALRDLGVGVAAIMSNDPTDYPEDSFDNMATVAHENDFSFPYLLDETQDVAKTYGAVATPDFFGYNKDLLLQYRGRFDSSGMSNKPRAKRELFEAMQQIAKTGAGPKEQKPSVGCSIKWR